MFLVINDTFKRVLGSRECKDWGMYLYRFCRERDSFSIPYYSLRAIDKRTTEFSSKDVVLLECLGRLLAYSDPPSAEVEAQQDNLCSITLTDSALATLNLKHFNILL